MRFSDRNTTDTTCVCGEGYADGSCCGWKPENNTQSHEEILTAASTALSNQWSPSWTERLEHLKHTLIRLDHENSILKEALRIIAENEITLEDIPLLQLLAENVLSDLDRLVTNEQSLENDETGLSLEYCQTVNSQLEKKFRVERELAEKHPLESADAVDFNSSAASKDGGFLERFG